MDGSRAAALALAFGVLAGCTKTSNGVSGVRHSWTQAGLLRIAIATDLKDLNPLLSSNTADVFVDRLMFEPLVTADPKGNPLPMLAAQVPTLANGGISRDGMTITYHLRRGFTWTDGVAVTSADVKWSWEAIMNPNSDVVSRHGYDVIAASTTPGPYTVVVRLKRKFSPFVNTFFAESDQPYMIVPAHVLSRYPTINQAPFNDKPTVSDGPFKFVSWTHGDHIVLARNDRFLLGRPHIDRIDVRTVPDEDTAINLLRTHAIDYMFQASVETLSGAADASRRPNRLGKRQRLLLHSVQPRAAVLGRPARPPGAGLRDRQERTGAHAGLRDADGRDRGHSRLDVGVQSPRTFLRARSRAGTNAAARGGVAARPRRHHA